MMIDESVAIVDMRIYWWLCWSKMQKQIAFFEWFNAFFEGEWFNAKSGRIYFPRWTDTGHTDFRIEKFSLKIVPYWTIADICHWLWCNFNTWFVVRQLLPQYYALFGVKFPNVSEKREKYKFYPAGTLLSQTLCGDNSNPNTMSLVPFSWLTERMLYLKSNLLSPSSSLWSLMSCSLMFKQ